MRFASASSFNRSLVSASVSSSRIDIGGHCVRELFFATGMVETTPGDAVRLELGRRGGAMSHDFCGTKRQIYHALLNPI